MKTIRVPKGQSFRSKLIRLGACNPALDWVGKKSLRCAWRTCDRADWLTWLASRAGVYPDLVSEAQDNMSRAYWDTFYKFRGAPPIGPAREAYYKRRDIASYQAECDAVRAVIPLELIERGLS